mgnify:FL=1|jgi:methyl-accepting chemotaxis protein
MRTSKLTIKFKVMFFTAAIMLVGGTCLAIISFYNQTSQLESLVTEVFDNFEHDFKAEQTKQSLILSTSLKILMSDKDLIEAFADQHRDKVKSFVLDQYQQNLKPNLGLKQFQFHVPPATSFFRAHKPQKFDDDLSGFRQTVLDTNSGQKRITGFEVGRGGPGLRIVHPVSYKNKHIGSVEFGGGIDSILKFAQGRSEIGYTVGILENVFKKAKRFTNQEKDIIKDNLVFYTFSDDSTRSHFKNLLHSKKVFNKSEEQDVAIQSFPLNDYSGHTIGSITMIKDVTEITNQIRTQIFQQIGIILFITALLLILLWLIITRTVFKPLSILTLFIERLQRGKITERYPITSEDEINKIATSVNQLADSLELKTNHALLISEGNLTTEISLASKEDTLGIALQTMATDLNGMISQIAEHASNLLHASNNLADITTKISENVSEVSAQSETVAGASKEISSNTDTVAASVEEISANIQSIASTSTEMSLNMTAVSETGEKMADSSKKVTDKSKKALSVSSQAQVMSEEANNVMKTLGDSAHEIGKVTDMIKDIAQQTNLLALNANIEAASAGEAGKGFAVVANEIKELAKQSAIAAQDIANKIGTIQENTDEAVESIGEITGIIGTIRNEATEIADMAINQSEFAQEISSNVTESASGFKEISMLIEEMGNGTSESAKSSKELALGSTEISNNVNKVNLSIKEIAVKVEEITTETGGLSGLSKTLSSMVGKFTLK